MTHSTETGAERAIDGTLSVDVEEWFCAHNLSPPLLRKEWEEYERRAEACTVRLLDIMDAQQARATFFMLGWVMERSPGLAAEIHRRGHEVATHGYSHHALTDMTPDEFTRDLDAALEVHARQVPADVLGYRAPSFTLRGDTMWIIPILESRGLRYSSSVFPMRGHPVYGMPNAPLEPWRIGATLMEIPLTVAQLASLRVPCAGGAYLRLLPFTLMQGLLRSVRRQGRLLNVYMHPWEFDPDQPRVAISLQKRLRHYHNLHRTEDRFRRLLSEFHFTSIKELPCLR
jgi:polysaccharide deacetylase family protein (PEP-CTERM system associated)